MTDAVALHIPGAARHAVMRCRTGTHDRVASLEMGPASAAHRFALHRARDTRVVR
jgi:hypothetical protein